MHRFRSTMTIVSLAIFAAACGGSNSTTAPGNTNTTGSGRTMTATFNGVSFSPTLLTSAYLQNTVAVNANDATRSLVISAVNVTAAGTYSVAAGNPNSALVTWLDGVGNFSSAAGGSGTVTFTVLQLGRVAGSFNVVVKDRATTGGTSITLIGTFDIRFP